MKVRKRKVGGGGNLLQNLLRVGRISVKAQILTNYAKKIEEQMKVIIFHTYSFPETRPVTKGVSILAKEYLTKRLTNPS